MPPFNIDTDRIYKYAEELKWEETKAWMENAQKAFIDGFNGVYFDYQQYRDFTSLEEKIATQIFGVDNEFAERAYRGPNLLCYFSDEQRKMATRIREKMERISGGNIIKMQVVPIAARMDDDLKRNESDTEEEKKKKEENKNTGRIYVFRVATPNGRYKFLDCELRVYKTWNKYLSKNNSPECIMCYPKDGILIKKSGNKHFANDVEFGEPPSCKWRNQLKAKLDKIVVVATPAIALASACCPATWALTATYLSYTSLGLYCYSIGTQGLQLIDQIKYGEDYGASLMNFITSIGTMIVNKGLTTYLRRVATIGRPLSTMESVVISGFLLGLAGSQVASFALMTCHIATKPKITPMDIVSYVVACHNLYSCIVSPKFASTLLERVKNKIKAEQMKDIENNKAALEKEEKMLQDNRQKLQDLQANGNTFEGERRATEDAIRQGQEPIIESEKKIQESDLFYTEQNQKEVANLRDNIKTNQSNLNNEQSVENQAEIEELERAIQESNRKIEKLKEQSTLKDQNKFLDNQENKMKDEGAKIEYKSEDALEQREDNRKIDQNGNIIHTIIEMGAGVLFKMHRLSKTGSTVQLSNGEQLDLCLNSQFDIYSRFRNQMSQITKNIKTDIQNIMELTRQYVAGQVTDETEYLERIKTCLKPYCEMINCKEIDIVKELINSWMPDLAKQYKKNEYLLRTVLKEAPRKVLQLARRLAAAYDGDISISTLFSWIEIVKDEYSKFKMPDPVTETLQERINYYKEQEIPDKIAGMMNNEMSEAADRANANGNDGNKEELFFQQFNDQANFDAKLAAYRKEFEKINEYAKSEVLTFPNPVAAYNHVIKHGRDSRNFVNNYDCDLPKNTTTQDATSTIYRDGRGYFGVTKCSYDAALGRETGMQDLPFTFQNEVHNAQVQNEVSSYPDSFVTRL